MGVTVCCPRCGGKVRPPDLMSSEWRCEVCGPVRPLHVPRHISPEILRAVLGNIDEMPLWCPWPLPAGGSRQPRHAFRQLTPAVPERLCQPIHLRSPQGRLRGQVDDSAPRADQEHRGNAAGRARQAAGQEVRPGPRRHRHDGRADEGLPEQPQRPLSATRQFSPQDAHEIPRRHRAAGGKGEAEGREQRGAADVRGGGDYTARVHGRLDDHPAQRVDGVPARIAGVGRDQEQRLADDGRRQA